jgi:hypothetical protein
MLKPLDQADSSGSAFEPSGAQPPYCAGEGDTRAQKSLNSTLSKNANAFTTLSSRMATDNCAGASFVLTSINSNEPDNGQGDCDTTDDIQDAGRLAGTRAT